MAIFETLRHPFVFSSAPSRAEILRNAERPEWRRFLEEAAGYFRHRDPAPPTFPAFCDDGGLDEIMAASVLAYVTRERIYFDHLAVWLRGMIALFSAVREKWEDNLRRIVRGQRPITEKPFFTENPRQFFEGFSGSYYFTEAGLMACAIHLLDMVEAYAPGLLSSVEKRQTLAALAHFADRYAFHEEALKYSNRGIWANAGVLISALCQQDPVAAALLLQQARGRNHQLRSTFFDDGGYAEGAWAYHAMAMDGLICYALIAEGAFGQSLAAGTSAAPDDVYAGYPALETLVRTYVSSVIPGPLPRENPRGHGCHYSHQPVWLRPSLLYAYARGRDAQIGWLIERLRPSTRAYHPSHHAAVRSAAGELRPASRPTPLPVTPTAILGLGSFIPLLNFWLDLPVTNAAPLPRGLSIWPDFGGVISRGDCQRDDRSTAWAHYGFLGTGKGHRDTLHVGLAVGEREILADPFPRNGPAGHISSLMHNTVIMDRSDPPTTIGQLLEHVSGSHADAWIMQNAGGQPPRRAFMSDPRAESRYYFDVDPCPSPGFWHRRAVLHFHDRALIVLDLVRADNGYGHVFDTMFHTLTPALNIPPDDGGAEETYHWRPFVRGEPARAVALRMHPLALPPGDSAILAFDGEPPFRLLAWSFGQSPTLAWATHSFPAGGPNVFGLRFRRVAAEFHAAYALTWDAHAQVDITVTNGHTFRVRLGEAVGEVNLDRANTKFASEKNAGL